MYLARGLSAVSARLEAQEAAATLLQAMTNTNDARALRYLAEGLAAVSARLDAQKAANLSATAATLLTQVMTMTNDPGALGILAEGLSAVWPGLDAQEAAAWPPWLAPRFMQTITLKNDTNAWYLAQHLSAVLGNDHRDKRARAVAATVGCLRDSQGLPGAVLMLRPASEPFPPPPL